MRKNGEGYKNPKAKGVFQNFRLSDKLNSELLSLRNRTNTKTSQCVRACLKKGLEYFNLLDEKDACFELLLTDAKILDEEKTD